MSRSRGRAPAVGLAPGPRRGRRLSSTTASCWATWSSAWDTARLLFPIKAFAVARLRHGHLPLWYPFESLGTPFVAAGVTGVFHPFTWLAVALGPVLGHALATLGAAGLVGWGHVAAHPAPRREPGRCRGGRHRRRRWVGARSPPSTTRSSSGASAPSPSLSWASSPPSVGLGRCPG